MTLSLKGKTLFITGASRGIGKAIALKAAADGANVALFAKTTEPHPKLPGTIYTAAEEVRDAGGTPLVCVGDIRHEEQLKAAIDQTVKAFGGKLIVAAPKPTWASDHGNVRQPRRTPGLD